MAPPSPPGSPSDDCLLRSSPHGSNTASEHSYLADQDTPTSPTPNTNTHSRTSYTPYKQSKRNTMPSPGNFEVIGFSRIGSHNHQSTSVSQASTLVSQESRCETLRTGAPFEGASTESWERPQVVQESQRIEDFDPMEDLPVKDWEGLEMRYERDMEAAIQHEQSLIDEIEWVMKVCGRGACSLHNLGFC
jgi:hypothetical protein